MESSRLAVCGGKHKDSCKNIIVSAGRGNPLDRKTFNHRLGAGWGDKVDRRDNSISSHRFEGNLLGGVR